METILLIIKSKNSYIRVKEDGYHLCGLDKASVFPPDRIDRVKEHVEKMTALGFEDIRIKKLSIREEDL